MALSRIGNRADLALLFAKSLACTATACCSSHQGHRAAPLPRSRDAGGVGLMHASVARRYPEAPALPLPYNVSEILNIETSRFAPERARDLGGPDLLLPRAGGADGGPGNRRARCSATATASGGPLPSHRVDSYDCNGAISLSGSMQTNVPKPFRAGGRSTYLNMPGGLWARDGKYIAEVMRESHFTVYRACSSAGGRLRGEPAGPWSRNYTTGAKDTRSSQSTKGQSIDPELKLSPKYEALSKKEKMKILLKDYGRVILFFHVGISIVSLAVFYVLVSSGLDLEPIIKKILGAENDDTKDKYLHGIVNQSSTFLIAYGVHKLFAPVRLSVTLACCPIIVRFLRRRGILEPLYKVNK